MSNEEKKVESLEETKLKSKEGKKPARKRVKKDRVSPLIKEINIMLETGKYSFGARRAKRELLVGETKVVILADKSKKEVKEDITYYCKKGNIPLITFEGTSLELGSVCGRAHPVSVIVVFDEGKSKLVEIAKNIK